MSPLDKLESRPPQHVLLTVQLSINILIATKKIN